MRIAFAPDDISSPMGGLCHAGFRSHFIDLLRRFGLGQMLMEVVQAVRLLA